MDDWRSLLRYDPVPPLLASESKAINYFCRKDLLEETVDSVENLWELPEASKILRKQKDTGEWIYPGKRPGFRSGEDYDQIETFRNLGFLVEKFALDRRHSAIQRAAEFLFSRQTTEGDLRGIYGNQYSPNYTAAMMELLIKAGYEEDPRIEHGFHWLLSMRQEDGGWAIPLRTTGEKFDMAMFQRDPIPPRRGRPSSHLATGVALRAFAAHPRFKNSDGARAAGELLAWRFFLPDKYPDRREVSYWTAFSFPFWFTDLLSALDSLSRMGFSREHPQISKGLEWFIERQQPDGGWDLRMLRTKDKELGLWIGLTICRVLKRFTH